MKHLLISLLTLSFILACGIFTPTSPPPNTKLGIPLPTFTPIPNPQTECKKRPVAFDQYNVGFGFPIPSYKLPSTGTVKTIILFVDFNDVPAWQTPEEVFSLISPNAENFFSDISYGRMNYVLEPYFEWLRLSSPSSIYGEATRSYYPHRDFILEAITLADANVDFSTADSVLVMVIPQAYSVPSGMALNGYPTIGYYADGKLFSNGATSGADFTSWGFLFLNHEVSHNMGLPDLYAYEYDLANYDDQHRFTGEFGLMGYVGGNAPEFFAYERWQLGWLDDEQIVCQTEGEQITTLTAIESIGGIKAVMIPVSETKVVVVESRRRLGYDANLVKEGALVYTVDTSIYSGEGPLVVYPILENDPYREQSPLAVGESITVEGVTITVLEATNESDTVQVTVNQ